MTTYTIEEIRMAAYNWVELPDMSERDRALWVGLGYCYEWYRARPNEKKNVRPWLMFISDCLEGRK